MLPPWAAEIAALYESHAAAQFIVHGNVEDRFVLPGSREPRLGGLKDFFLESLLGRFAIVLSYDLGNGLRVERGGELLAQWPAAREHPQPPRHPLPAVEWLTRFFRYQSNLRRLQPEREIPQTACIIWSAHLIAPSVPGAPSFELGAIASLMRDWAVDDSLLEAPLATFLVAGNLHDLHPLITSTPRAAKIKIPLPGAEELAEGMKLLGGRHAGVLEKTSPEEAARSLAGCSLHAVESLFRSAVRESRPLDAGDIAALRKRIVEEESQELIEFVPPRRTLADLHGLESIKARFREDCALWAQGDLEAMPMGYLICGPVGTGKTYLVECLAGEAGVPVVKIRNFRDRWIGSTESNLEKIFRLLHALGRCFVFVDEADQALGRRESQAGDSGLSGRIYSMLAKEMSDPGNRGRILWVLATSRPDLIEVDLKRPGRVDVKLPIFPTATPGEGYGLLRALCLRKGAEIPEEMPGALSGLIPDLLTPGAAEAVAVRVYRLARASGRAPVEALREALSDYQAPVAPEVLRAQIALAVREASELSFVPERFREG